MKIEKIWLTDDSIFIRTENGQVESEKFHNYPRLRHATKKQLQNFETDDFGIHWKDLDEDLSFEGFFEKKEPTELYKLFINHPELNVSAIARRMGISQSLMAQYISGAKKPSIQRLMSIRKTIRSIGQELIAV